MGSGLRRGRGLRTFWGAVRAGDVGGGHSGQRFVVIPGSMTSVVEDRGDTRPFATTLCPRCIWPPPIDEPLSEMFTSGHPDSAGAGRMTSEVTVRTDSRCVTCLVTSRGAVCAYSRGAGRLMTSGVTVRADSRCVSCLVTSRGAVRAYLRGVGRHVTSGVAVHAGVAVRRHLGERFALGPPAEDILGRGS